MTRRHSPLQQVKEAKQIAREHGLYVVEKSTTKGIDYLLYRETGRAYLGKRSSAAGIRSLVCRVANYH